MKLLQTLVRSVFILFAWICVHTVCMDLCSYCLHGSALGFGPDWIRTLVSMATDSSHRVIMGKTL